MRRGRAILRGAWRLAREGWPALLAAAILATGLSFLLFPHDAYLLARLHFLRPGPDAGARRIAWDVGLWGDYPTYNLPVALALWLYGAWTKNRAWRRIAMVCFLGAALPSLLDDSLRLTLGRPRPDAHMADGFYGVPAAWHGGFQSFPSGHAAAVVGMAVALLMVNRPLGLATGAYAMVVLWARLELNRHYPSDVLVGAIIGLVAGLLIGCGARARGRCFTKTVSVAIPTPVVVSEKKI